MKKNLLIFGALLLLVCSALLFAWRSAPPEPVWHGRTLTAWTDDLAVGSSVQIREEAEKALRGVGTKAIPHLLRMLRTRDTLPRRGLLWLNRRQNVFKFRVRPAREQHVRAWMAFQALGEKAEPALPQLRQMLLSEPRTDFLSESIAVISPKSVPILMEAVPRAPTELQFGLITAARRWPSQEDLVMPVVLRSLTSTNLGMRMYAAAVLGGFMSNRVKVVSALMSALNDPEPAIRAVALNSLTLLGANAPLPVLPEAGR
jgi:hypothetical protein